MRIKEFSIRNYGPLPDSGVIKLSDFNLIYGLNETGKTLTIEALIKLLLGKHSKRFAGIDRVNMKPDGYIIMNTANEDIKIPEMGYIYDITKLNPSECRNIFIIRNSDLSIKDELGLYTDIADRLTGLKSKEIEELKEKILRLVRITSKYQFSDKKEDEHLKKRLDIAENLIEEIKNLFCELDEKNLLQLEPEYINLSDTYKIKNALRKKYEDARRREQYEKGKNALKKREEKLREKEILEEFTKDHLQKWSNANQEIKRLNNELDAYKKELHEKGKTLKILENNIKELEIEFDDMKNKKEMINELGPEIHNAKNMKINMAAKEAIIPYYRLLLFIFSILSVISIIGQILHPSLLFSILSGIFIISNLTIIVLYLRLKIINSNFLKNLERISIKLNEIGIESKAIEEIIKKIKEFQNIYEHKEKHLNNKKVEMLSLKNDIENIINERIPKIENKRNNNEEVIDKIKDASLSLDIDDYRNKLKEKEKCERIVNEQEEVLKSLFGEENWDAKINELSSFANSASSLKYDEKEFKDLVDELDEYSSSLDNLEADMNYFKDRLQKIEGNAKYILSNEDIRCDGFSDLKMIKNKVEKFVKRNTERREDAIKIIEILNEINEEEKSKIEELIGEKSLVSKYFSKITDGLYKKLNFNKFKNDIVATLKDGSELTTVQLSGGAYDQLYLSIRLALGEKLLTDNKGFFILDDPFIKASPDRLKTMMDILKKISNEGWQIIYFSAKGEVKEILYEDIKNNSVEYIPMKSMIIKE